MDLHVFPNLNPPPTTLPWGSSISIQQEPKQYFTRIIHVIHPKPHGYIHIIIIPILQVGKLRPCKKR